MARADRLERMDTMRILLEAEYRTLLIAALERCAAGRWGLFDHNRGRGGKPGMTPEVTELIDMGDEIDALRDTLDLEPFALHLEFLASRGPVKASAVGEPKQACAWLERLAE